MIDFPDVFALDDVGTVNRICTYLIKSALIIGIDICLGVSDISSWKQTSQVSKEQKNQEFNMMINYFLYWVKNKSPLLKNGFIKIKKTVVHWTVSWRKQTNTELSNLLTGDCGDHVVVINTKHIAFSGNKWEQKVYSSHTGYVFFCWLLSCLLFPVCLFSP